MRSGSPPAVSVQKTSKGKTFWSHPGQMEVESGSGRQLFFVLTYGNRIMTAFTFRFFPISLTFTVKVSATGPDTSLEKGINE